MRAASVRGDAMSIARVKRIWRSNTSQTRDWSESVQAQLRGPSGLLHGALPHTPTADSNHRNLIIAMIARAVQLFQQSLSLVSTLWGQVQYCIFIFGIYFA